MRVELTYDSADQPYASVIAQQDAQARAALDAEVRERDGRARQLERTRADRDDWSRRATAAAQRRRHTRRPSQKAKAMAAIIKIIFTNWLFK